MHKRKSLVSSAVKLLPLAQCVGLALASAAYAQPAPKLEEVVVSAQKREEVAQAVPMAMSALNEDALKKIGFSSFDTLSDKVPALDVKPYFAASSTLRIYMRGVGLDYPQELSRDNAVGVYLDDVYVPHGNGLAAELSDIERIEVLQGPQGTLYGRNTIGGAVKFISAKPTGEWGFKQSIDSGNFGLFRSTTTINVPEINRVSSKFTVLKASEDGWVSNSGTGGDYGQKDADGYRAALRWRATDTVLVDYVYDFTQSDGTSQYTQHQYATRSFPFTFPVFRNRQERTWRPVDTPIRDDFTSSGHALTVAWDFADTATLKSISAYRMFDSEQLHDAAEAYNLPFLQRQETDAHQFSQELLLSGEFGARIKYHLGAFYFSEAGDQAFAPLRSPGALAAAVPYVPPKVSDQRPDATGDVENKSMALYTQITWVPPVFDDRVTIDIGGRESRDKRSLVAHHPENAPLLPVDSENEVEHSSFDPSFTVDYKWTNSLHTYAKIAKAYRSGGFDETNPLASEFDPEHLTSIEAGLKSMWWDDRLRFNIDVFHEKFRDIQINFPNPARLSQNERLTVNAGSATIKGGDLNIEVLPLDGWMLRGDYTYLKQSAEVTNPFNGRIIINQLPSIPKQKYSVSSEYTFAPFEFGKLAALISFDHSDKQITPGAAVADDYTPGYGLLNARLTLSDISIGNSHLSVALWCNNVTDREYQVYHNIDAVVFGKPRNYGVTGTFGY
jgi:iron complex outermembrane recepter protein